MSRLWLLGSLLVAMTLAGTAFAESSTECELRDLGHRVDVLQRRMNDTESALRNSGVPAWIRHTPTSVLRGVYPFIHQQCFILTGCVNHHQGYEVLGVYSRFFVDVVLVPGRGNSR